ncbi:cyanophycinase [Rheinheimera baltica]|uniref:Cyanophycinase n=1 Tax=Rheinheimera baltica TaxID=67576 RepID=A0ABT9I2N8_9GAMM|nr:cyanophycinase [Rheinheimera baltica]MDP5137638.1 cyanophycinase [Rheinheimera baltica]
MKSFSFYTAAAILACNASAANVNDTKSFPDYSMVLVGGGLQTCSSVDVRYCSGPEPFTAASKSDEAFMLSPEHLANIADNAFWTEERVIEQQQTLALLEYMRSKVKSERVSERELLRMWRSAEIEIDGIWVSGRTNYSALSDRERNFVLDQLQVMAVVSTDSARSTPKRQKEFADLSKTKDGFTVEIYKKIVELAQQVAGSQRKPRILVVTASGRDPFAAVDMYVNVFKEAGADVSWLPLNAAYQAAQHSLVNDAASCDQLPQYLAAYHGTFQRDRVYPDLMQELNNFCKQGSDGAVEQIRRADAVFISGGDQSLAVQAFRQPDGSATPELKQIESMIAAGQIIVAGTSAGTAVMAGGSYQGKRTPMITNGDSYNAIQYGAFDLPAPQPGCDRDQSCTNGLAENHLTFNGQGGLGLFNWGILDTHFSERGRQGRLVRLQNDTQTRFGFGIDEATALLVAAGRGENSPDVVMEVIGAAGVYIVDNEKSQSSGEGAATSITNVSTHYLTRDDKLEIKDGFLRTRFADWKFAANNTLSPMLSSSELFERNNYKQLAQLLCTTQSRRADAKAVRIGQGHTVNLYKDMSSYTRQGVYRQQGVDIEYCSYRNLMLDIQPANQ